MIVERLDVENVRNITAGRLEFDPGINVLAGANGAGKTAVLESLHLLFRGRSFRTSRTEGIVRHGQSRLAVGVRCRHPEQGQLRLSYVREQSRAEWRRDGVLLRQSSAAAQLLPIQVLLPDVAELVFGGPGERRRWLDWGAFHVKPDHAAALRDFLRVLRHRNALLRSGELETLPAWTGQLAELGEVVAEARQSYLRRVQAGVLSAVDALSPGLSLSLELYPGWKGESLAEALGRERDRDVKSGVTNAGPHRAEVGISCGSVEAVHVLSRGQGKAVASALRLAQAMELAGSGKPTLFLIDDVGAELDRAHNERFFALLDEMGGQIVATSTQAEASGMLDGPRKGRLFHVKQGTFEAA